MPVMRDFDLLVRTYIQPNSGPQVRNQSRRLFQNDIFCNRPAPQFSAGLDRAAAFAAKDCT